MEDGRRGNLLPDFGHEFNINIKTARQASGKLRPCRFIDPACRIHWFVFRLAMGLDGP